MVNARHYHVSGRSYMGIATLPNGHIVITGGGDDSSPVSLAT
jgi:hypothetical protein